MLHISINLKMACKTLKLI